jgi:esterase
MDASDQLRMLEEALALSNLRPSSLALPEDHQMIIGNMRFHYLDWSGNGYPILFLHGGGLNAHTWDLVCVMLHDRYRCIALDQRGHGDSEWSPTVDYAVETQVRDIEGFIEQLGLTELVLVGQSMGGLNSIAYAIRHSDKLRGLVVVDVAPEINPAGAQRIREFASTPELDSLEAFLERAVKFNPLRSPTILKRSLYYNLRRTPTGRWALKHDQRRGSPEFIQIADAQRDRLAQQLGAIRSPTLIVRGALSDVLTDEAADRFARSLSNGRWTKVERAGHNVQGDNPAGLLEAVLPFLKEIGL